LNTEEKIKELKKTISNLQTELKRQKCGRIRSMTISLIQHKENELKELEDGREKRK
jgi:hypothetical protein